MSRTWKDRPDWVMINDPNFTRVDLRHHHYNGTCEINTVEVPPHVRRGMKIKWSCRKIVHRDNARFSTKEAHLFWWDSDRARTRDGMRDFVKDYNGNCDVQDGDYDFFNRNHRHDGMWYYW